MKILMRCLVCLSLLLGHNGQASPSLPTAIIYQPWLPHLQLSKQQAQQIVRESHKLGYQRFIVQWTRYNQISYWPRDDNPLIAAMLKQPSARVVWGLYADSAYFQLIQKDNDKQLATYLHYLRAQHSQQAINIYQTEQTSIDGWYLPEEIDDLNWQTPQRTQLLVHHLQTMRKALKALAPNKPLYISAFYAGHQTPQEYANWLAQIAKQTDVHWLIQGGQGVIHPLAPDTTAFLHQLTQQLGSDSWSGLMELFAQQNSEHGTSALFCPLDDESLRQRQLRWHNALQQTPDVAFALNHLFPLLFDDSWQGCR